MAVDYSDLAATYDRTRSRPGEFEAFWWPAIARLTGVRPGARILDVGCGTGRLTVPLSESHMPVGVDSSAEMLSVARGKGGRAAFVRGDACALPFRDGSFDLALAVMVLQLVRDVPAAVAELARVARTALIATIDMQTRARHAIDEAFPSLQRIDEARFPRIADLQGACRQAGYRRVTTEVRRRHIESMPHEFIERVRARYVSTLSILPPGEFERGLAWLEAELPKRGPRYAYEHAVTFVAASG